MGWRADIRKLSHIGKDSVDIRPCFFIGWNAAVFGHFGKTGIIGGQRQRNIPLEGIKQKPQIAYPAIHVLARIKTIGHLQALGGSRHQLHQATGTGPRYRLGVIAGLGLDHGPDQRGADTVLARRSGNQVLKLLGIARCCPETGAQLLILAQVTHEDLELLAGGGIGEMDNPLLILVTVNIGGRRTGQQVPTQRHDAEQQQRSPEYAVVQQASRDTGIHSDFTFRQK